MNLHDSIVDRPLGYAAQGAVKTSYFDCDTLLSAIPDAVVVVDHHGNIIQTNDTVVTMFGYTSSQIVGSPIEVLLPERFRAAHVGQRNGYLAAPTARPMGAKMDLLARHQSGEEFPVEVSLSPINLQAKCMVICIIRDISERKFYDQQLRKAEARYRSVVERMPAVTFMAALDGGINELYVSPQIESMLGFTQSEWLGDPVLWYRQLHPDDQERWHREFSQTCATGESFRSEYRFLARDGRIVWVHGEATMVRDDQGAPLFLQGFAYDISERKQAEQALRRSQEELEALVRERTAELAAANLELQKAKDMADAANQTKSTFLANMSHEIRTPLTAILGFTDLLRDDTPDPLPAPQRNQTVDTIKNAGTHLLTVINDILDLSKIEANMLAIERIETSLVEILKVIGDLLRPRAVEKGVAFQVEFATPLPQAIYSDPTRLRQILMNLAGNAVKFTQAGQVAIRAGIKADSGTERLLFEVVDTGPGLTAEGAERLFQAFTQADDTVTRKHGGTGLGLKISRRLAELMGGSVTLARTELGKGSCFRIDLPLEPVPGTVMVQRLDVVNQTAVEKPEIVPPKLCGRVLLAEDGPDNQRLIAFHLRKAGAEIDVANNGRIALEMIEQAAAMRRPYELLLTDMQMPEMDGYTLARTLRVQGSRLPIVALTAHAMAEDRQKCLDAGCDDYASKPIDKYLLLSTCEKWLVHARQRNAVSIESFV